MEDLRTADIVEIEIDSRHPKQIKVWINVDGRCIARIQKAKRVVTRTEIPKHKNFEEVIKAIET